MPSRRGPAITVTLPGGSGATPNGGFKGRDPVVTDLTDAATVTWSQADTNDVLRLLATSGVGATRALSNSPSGSPVDGYTIQVEFTQDATGGRLFTTGTAVVIPTELGGGTTFPVDSTLNKSTLLALRYSARAAKWVLVGVIRGY